jgi:heptosyltransferase-1
VGGNSELGGWTVVRVVLVRLSALGDIVHTWPLAVALRDADPQIHLSWVVEEPFQPMVEGHPSVDAVLTTRTRAWRRRPLASTTRAEIALLKGRFSELQPDLAIDSQGLLKSALVSRWTGARRRVGLARPWRRERLARFAYTEVISGAAGGAHVAATNLELVRALGADPPSLTPPDGSWLLEGARARGIIDVSENHPYAVVLPGAGGAHKVLTETTLAAVGGELAGSGLEVVVAWGPGEIDRARRVVAGAGTGVRLAPPTSLLELSVLLGGASLVIGGDTGPVHLAASFSVPTVAVFLASDPRRNGPLGAKTAVVAAAAEALGAPRGSARARPSHRVDSAEIVETARRLLDTST